MDKKTILIMGIIAIIIAVVLMGNVSSTADNGGKTNLTITSDKNLTDGEVFSVKLTDENGTGIANKTVYINLTGSNNTTTINVSTDLDGKANFTIDFAAGSYAVNASFMGDENYNSSYVSQDLNISEAIAATDYYESDSESSSGSQSYSSGNDEIEGEIVYSTDPNSDKSVLDENGNIDQDKVDYYNQEASEKYGPIG